MLEIKNKFENTIYILEKLGVKSDYDFKNKFDLLTFKDKYVLSDSNYKFLESCFEYEKFKLEKKNIIVDFTLKKKIDNQNFNKSQKILNENHNKLLNYNFIKGSDIYIKKTNLDWSKLRHLDFFNNLDFIKAFECDEKNNVKICLKYLYSSDDFIEIQIDLLGELVLSFFSDSVCVNDIIYTISSENLLVKPVKINDLKKPVLHLVKTFLYWGIINYDEANN
jgi:hypothetical protein